MSLFFTPNKQQPLQTPTARKSNNSARDGDWVCYQCNNLNYSFRKKCNRCKIQTREQNKQLQAFYYHYIPQNYLVQKENFPSLSSASSINRPSQKTEPKSAGKSQNQAQFKKLQVTPQKLQENRELPSVSPLLKRYNRNQNYSTQESQNGGLFQNQAIWANIDLKYFDDPLLLSQNNDFQEINFEIEHIQKTIQKIML